MFMIIITRIFSEMTLEQTNLKEQLTIIKSSLSEIERIEALLLGLDPTVNITRKIDSGDSTIFKGKPPLNIIGR